MDKKAPMALPLSYLPNFPKNKKSSDGLPVQPNKTSFPSSPSPEPCGEVSMNMSATQYVRVRAQHI